MEKSDRAKALEIARKAVGLWVTKKKKFIPKKLPSYFKEKKGVFVTIYTWPEKELRGCIGYPEPYFDLASAICMAAVHACADPRFEPLKSAELNSIVIEVSILTKPELIKVKRPDEYPKRIKIGQDGLVVRKGPFSGLLLPQVASEHGLDEHEFLIQTCLKAGLPPGAWMDSGTKIYRFWSEIFSESKPRGKAEKK